ncbi:MAG: hypothetical protein ACRDMH_01040 [Solirubrobacterales bacterium]
MVFVVLTGVELFGGTLVYVLGLRRSNRIARVLGATLAVAGPIATVLLVVALNGAGD